MVAWSNWINKGVIGMDAGGRKKVIQLIFALMRCLTAMQ